MKTTKKVLLLVASCAVLMFSCKKQSDSTPVTKTPVTTPSTPGFSAKVNGVKTTWPGYCFFLVSGGTYIYGLTSSDPADWQIQLSLVNKQAVGTYPIGTSSFIDAAYEDAVYGLYKGKSGVITVSSLANGKISGTFSFSDTTRTPKLIITDGVFTDVPLK